jgi:DNA helicase II / ATP-dependent DNA helicase PcrA
MNLESLNEAQKKAVLENEGPLMILAGAGSGKTKTLVTKIQYLIEEKNISPYYILAVTFSNKAAKEMRERVARTSNIDVGALQITTFHAFCSKLLRMEATYLGLSRNFSIYDDSESKTIVKSLMAQRGVSLKEVSPYEILQYISSLKNQGYYLGAEKFDMNDIDINDPWYEYFVDYERELSRSNAVDFGGLITGVIQLFEKYPEVLERYKTKFRYLLVDEYQDTNRAQFKLVELLAQKYRNVCVVGDEDQSIYSWRGADIRNILDFEKYYPDAKFIKLEQNYRSSKNIIEAATAVISNNLARKGKNMWTDNQQGESIEIIEVGDDRIEANLISEKIKKILSSGVSPEEVAIFYRNNAQSRMIEDSLLKSNIKYRVVAGIKFYERKEVKDMLAYLRLLTNEKDSLALSRIINVPVRGIGARTLRKIEDEAVRLQTSLWDIFEKLIISPHEFEHLKLASKVKSAISRFVSLIQEAKSMTSADPSALYEKILYESGYYEMLSSEKSYESQARLENLDELKNAIIQYEHGNPEATLTGYLETITLDHSEDDDHTNLVSLMTIHGSKGLEYRYVFLIGAEENIFPSFQSIEGGEDKIEEERRLFYVAMTRAMEKLYIIYARGRMLWGSIKFNGPSRFIDEIPENYYTHTLHKVGNEFERNSSFEDFSQEERYHESPSLEARVYQVKSTKPASYAKFPVGEKVMHKIYGKGSIVASDGSGNDEKATIQFQDGMKKKFMVKFAPIEKI